MSKDLKDLVDQFKEMKKDQLSPNKKEAQQYHLPQPPLATNELDQPKFPLRKIPMDQPP